MRARIFCHAQIAGLRLKIQVVERNEIRISLDKSIQGDRPLGWIRNQL
jgi:hypothetical protein